ncbi:Trypanosome variant surface glycoprotein (A-type), putative [Trypanosoma equiperdum]|uniref:Trypanosome variant surface glycoprotein (A-type), putative n=1 Tax=Trypanosoma equiperdum TaxID=5694 RepID=A0A1G4HZ34_TRYEQ|nr:Trypanosome variant surface glycoprotein (A-type), putative [Trypanosoma equiperdum]
MPIKSKKSRVLLPTAIALILFCAPQKCSATAGKLLSQQLCGPLAPFTARLEKTAGRSAKILKQREVNLIKLKQLQAKAQVCTAEINSNAKAAAYGSVAEVIGAEIKRITPKEKDAFSKFLKVTATTEILRGPITEFFQVTTALSAENTHGCLTTGRKAGNAGTLVTAMATPQLKSGKFGFKGLNEEPVVPPEVTENGFNQLLEDAGTKDSELHDDTVSTLFTHGVAGPVSTGAATKTSLLRQVISRAAAPAPTRPITEIPAT